MNVQCLVRIRYKLCLVMNIRLMQLATSFDFSNTKPKSEIY